MWPTFASFTRRLSYKNIEYCSTFLSIEIKLWELNVLTDILQFIRMFLQLYKHVHKVRSNNMILFSVLYSFWDDLREKLGNFGLGQHVSEQVEQPRGTFANYGFHQSCRIRCECFPSHPPEFAVFVRHRVHANTESTASNYICRVFCCYLSNVHGSVTCDHFL